MSSLITTILSLVNKLVGLLVPFFAYRKGQHDAKEEAQKEAAKAEVLSIKRILQVERSIKELNDVQLDNMLRGKPGNSNDPTDNKPTS